MNQHTIDIDNVSFADCKNVAKRSIISPVGVNILVIQAVGHRSITTLQLHFTQSCDNWCRK